MCRYTFINQKQDQTIVSIKLSPEDDTDEDAGKKTTCIFFQSRKGTTSFILRLYFLQHFLFLKGIYIFNY